MVPIHHQDHLNQGSPTLTLILDFWERFQFAITKLFLNASLEEHVWNKRVNTESQIVCPVLERWVESSSIWLKERIIEIGQLLVLACTLPVAYSVKGPWSNSQVNNHVSRRKLSSGKITIIQGETTMACVLDHELHFVKGNFSIFLQAVK